MHSSKALITGDPLGCSKTSLKRLIVSPVNHARCVPLNVSTSADLASEYSVLSARTTIHDDVICVSGLLAFSLH